MNPLESAAGGFGLIFIFAFWVFVAAWAILSFMLPFFVHGILNQAKRTNLLLQQLVTLAEQAQEEADQDRHAQATQVDNTFSMLKAIRDQQANGAQMQTLIQHAQYQTEVTKHRLETGQHGAS
jgi:hypothetical protein